MLQLEEFRVYYECLEQAEHFGRDVIHSVLGAKTPVRFVRIPNRVKSKTASSLMPGLAMKNPDLVISMVSDGTEVPLFWLEISTAARAEDHTQQRFDSMVAASKTNALFVKVKADRRSASEFGGNLNFSDVDDFKVARQQCGLYGVQLDWPTTSDRLFALRDTRRRACPPSDIGLTSLFFAVFKEIELHGQFSARHLSDSALLPENIREQLLTHDDLIVDRNRAQGSRLYRKDDRWILKFNRWEKAMDPERGMAWFYRYYFGERLSGRIHDKTATSRSVAMDNFFKFTGIRPLASRPSGLGEIDITKNIAALRPNRSGLAIIQNCDSFTVCDKEGVDLIRFVWNCHIDDLQSEAPKSAIELSDEVGEDEVTYATCHAFVGALELKTHSVSYPGAQGDFALKEGSGRGTKRTYIDVIAVDNLKSPSRILLIESKGKRNRASIMKDAEKARSWRDDPLRRRILLERLGADADAVVEVAHAYPGTQFLSPQSQPFHDNDYEIVVSSERLIYRHRDSPLASIALGLRFPERYLISE